MKKTIRPAAFVAIATVMVVAAFLLGHYEAKLLRVCGISSVARALDSGGANPKDFGLLFAVRDMVEENWVNNIDKAKEQEMVYGSIRGMLRSLGDQYTRFMDPNAFKNMSIETKGKFGGVGIQIGIRNQQLTVIAPIEDTPAAKAGLKSGDIIIKIDGKTTEDMALDDAVARIRGDRGTKVVLTIWRPGFDPKNGKDFELERDIIKLKNVSESKMVDGEIAYVKFDSFAATTAKSLKDQLLDFKSKKAKGLILDLRDNPGGLLDAAVDVANLFIDEGPIVHRVGRNKPNETYYAESGKKVWDLPVVVLVNGFSASASEILSGALQDDGIATLIGEKTFGKGLVQTVYPLADNSAVLITTDKYLTAKKRDINEKGIMPDIVVKMGQADSHEGADLESDDDVAPDHVGKFPIGEQSVKKGDGIVVFNSIPRNDVPFFVFKDKKFIEADDLQKLFGVALEYDKETNSLNISKDPETLKKDKDPQYDKALEVIKQKIADAAKKK